MIIFHDLSCLNCFILLVQITLNQEHKCMLSFAPDYDHLPLIAKVEVFEHALHNTEGNDLARVCDVCLNFTWYMVFYNIILTPSFTTYQLIGTLVEKSNIWDMAWEEDKLYEEFGSYEHGVCSYYACTVILYLPATFFLIPYNPLSSIAQGCGTYAFQKFLFIWSSDFILFWKHL